MADTFTGHLQVGVEIWLGRTLWWILVEYIPGPSLQGLYHNHGNAPLLL